MLEEDRILEKMRFKKESSLQSIETHKAQPFEDSLSGNIKFVELLEECDKHIHQSKDLF